MLALVIVQGCGALALARVLHGGARNALECRTCQGVSQARVPPHSCPPHHRRRQLRSTTFSLFLHSVREILR